MLALNKKINEQREKSMSLKAIALNCKDYKKSVDIAKKQDEAYKKFMFYKNLNKALQNKKEDI